MRSEIFTGLRVATAAVVFTSYMGLTATYRYTNSLLLVPLLALLLMPMAEALDRRFPLYQKMTWTASFLFALALPVLYRVIDNFLVFVIYLVTFIQLYTLFHEKRERNYDYLILMSFFLLLAASVMTPTPSIAVAFFLFIPSCVWLLFTLEMYSAQQCGSPAARVEIVDSPGRGSAAEEEGRRVFGLRAISGVGAIAAAIFLLTGIFFISIPRMEAGLFGTANPSNFRTDLSTQIEIASGIVIQRDTTAVMRAAFPEEPGGRYSGTLYWRASSLDNYTGRAWTRLGNHSRFVWDSAEQRESYEKFSSLDGWANREGIDRLPLRPGRSIVQDIFLARVPESGLPALPLVKKAHPLEGQKNVRLKWAKARDFTIAWEGQAESGMQYVAESEVSNPTDKELRNSSADYLSVISPETYRYLIKQFLLPKTRQLAEEIAADSKSPFDRMTAIELWLSSSRFTYSLDVPALPKDHPIDAFIHDTRTGHCELYASALALMGRSLGIPTRLVNGYRGGEWNPSDRSYTVTADMAHVWVEAYFPDFGWIAFDPSPPAAAVPGFSFEYIRRRFAQSTLSGKLFWYRNVVGFRPEAGLAFLKDASLSVVGWDRGPNRRTTGGQAPTPLDYAAGAIRSMIFLAGVALTVYLGLRLARTHRKRKGPSLSRDQTRATVLYASFLGRLKKRGIDCRGKTVEELREAIAEEAWMDEPAARSILSSYNAVRFGRRPLDAGLYGVLKKMVRSFRKRA